MFGTFTLTITLGNEAMQTADDIADALRRVAQQAERGDYTGSNIILDLNGNKVGTYTLDAGDGRG